MNQVKKNYHNKQNQNNAVEGYKKKHYPNTYQKKTTEITNGFFNGNLAPNMKFGSPGSELSGYVKRKVVVRDAQGNETTASEVQFFNSGKKIKVNVNGNESESIE